MRFRHSDKVWRDFPALVPGVLFASGITADAPAGARTDRFLAIARSRLEEMPEGEMPPIQAWRRAFSKMGLKPTQYRCASESLLRRFRKEGSLPRLHPLVDLCNAVSLAFAIPVAVFDVSAITGDLEVRYAIGDEDYVTFSGAVEHPAAGEVIFADAAGQAHARRWTNRQSGLSAVCDQTSAALIVAEALHDSAPADITELTSAIATELTVTWSVTAPLAVLTEAAPCFTFGALPLRRDGTRRCLQRSRHSLTTPARANCTIARAAGTVVYAASSRSLSFLARMRIGFVKRWIKFAPPGRRWRMNRRSMRNVTTMPRGASLSSRALRRRDNGLDCVIRSEP